MGYKLKSSKTAYNKRYWKANKDRYREYCQKNREIIRERQKAYRRANVERYRLHSRNNYQRHKEIRQVSNKRWRLNNLERLRAYHREYAKKYNLTHREHVNALARAAYARQKQEYVESGAILTPSAIRSAKWRREHPDYKRIWRRKHGTRLRARERMLAKVNRANRSAAHRRWVEKNREHIRIYQREDRIKKIGKYRAKSKRLYWANRERKLLEQRRWRERNPGWHRDYVAKNRERIKSWFKEWVKTNKNVKEKQAIGQKIRYGALDGGWLHSKWLKAGKLCYICGKILRRYDISIDHVFPASKGGSHAQSNLMPVHRRCNCKKANKIDFPAVRPDLIRKAA